MNDTIVIYRQPPVTWPDGMRSREDFVAVVLHRKPFEPVQPNRAPDAGSDRTVYVGNPSRERAIEVFEQHEILHELVVPRTVFDPHGAAHWFNDVGDDRPLRELGDEE